MRRARRGGAGIAVVIVLVVLQLVVVGVVLGGARDQGIAVSRLDSVRAFYAAEGGMNMALREIMLATDADADGTVGTISDDGNPANDPAFGDAQVSVSMSVPGGTTVLTSRGRSGEAVREAEASLQ
jgi:Tfp pilus assembly protein PilX